MRSGHKKLSDPKQWLIDPEASFFHFCSNETVHGFEITEDNFPWDLIPMDVPIVADMSSNIGTRPINWDRISVIYAGCQKNMGPAGCVLTIVRKSLLGHADNDVPLLCDWLTFESSPQC